MTHRALSGVFVCLAVLLTAVGARPAPAQTADDVLRFSLRSPTPSARALGMAGGGTAGWADLSAMATNPAGLGYYTSSAFSGGLDVLVADNSSSFRVGSGSPSGSSTNESAVRLGSFGGVYKMPTKQGSLVFGVGFTRQHAFDRTLRYEGTNQQSSITDTFLPRPNEFAVDDQGVFFPDDVPTNIIPFIAFQGGAIEFFQGDFDAGQYPFEQAVLPGTEIVQEGRVHREGRTNEINFAGAAEVAPNVMLGVSANIAVGQYQFQNRLTEIDQGENSNYEVLRDGEFFEGLDQLSFQERFESEFTGFNVRTGLSAELTPSVRVGLTVETPTWTAVSEDFTDAIVRTDFLDGTSLAYGNDPNEEIGKGTFDYSIRTPWRLGAGLAYDNDRLRVSADVEFLDWSNLELDSESFNFPEVNDCVSDEVVCFEDFEAVLNWRGGIEYDIAAGPSVRGGIAYRPDPRSFDFTAADGDTRDRSRTFLSLGISYPLGDQLTLDAGWIQERMDDQFQPYQAATPPNENTSIIPPLVDEEVTRNQVRVGFRYSF